MALKDKDKIISIVLISFFLILSLFVTITLFSTLTHRVLNETAPFDTDEADHANPALELATTLKRGDLNKTFVAIARQAFYPPVHSLIVASSYLISDVSLASSRIPTIIIFFVSGLLLFLLVRRLTLILYPENGELLAISVSSISLLLIFSSPIAIEHSVLCMLELTGILSVLILTYALAFKLHLTSFSNRQIALIALLGFIIFMTKYSFGIISLPALILTYFLKPSIFSNFKNNFYISFKLGLYLLGFLGIWLLFTDLDSFINFFRGHKSYAPLLSQENLLFEIRAWFNSYCLSPYVALFTLILAFIGSFYNWNNDAVRFSILNVLFAFFVLALSTTNEERHFMVALPSLFFLSAIGSAHIGAYISKIAAARLFSASIPAIVILILILSPMLNRFTELNNALTRQFECSPSFNELMQFISHTTVGSHSILVNGISDDFSIETLRWYVARSNQQLYTEVKVDAYPYRPDKYKTNRLRMRNLDKPWLDQTFPKKPMSKIIATGYYKYAIQVKNLLKEQRFKAEAEDFSAATSTFQSLSLERDGRRVTIFNLSSKPPSSE